MNIILSESSASCVVQCPWESPVQRKLCYARVSLSDRSRKRQLGKSKRKGSHCVVQASVWSSSDPTNGFTSKAFRKEGVSESVIVASAGPGRLIGISNALDSTLCAKFTWLLVAISGNHNRGGIALLRFEKEGIKLKKVFSSPESPLQGVVLRGPHVLYRTSENLLLEGSDGKVALSGFGDEEIGSGGTQFFVCGTEHDAETVVATTDTREGNHGFVRLRRVRSSGVCGPSWTAKDAKGFNFNVATVSLRRGIFAMADYGGSLRILDINSGVLLWKTLPRKELENPICISFYRDTLLVTAQGSETVWGVSDVALSSRNGSVRNPTLLFPQTCGAAKQTEKHGHLFAPWRESLLQLSDKNGTYCLDQGTTSTVFAAAPHQENAAPFMDAVSRNLERRLDVGVERVTDAAERQEEKSNILNHLRSLLTEATGKRTSLGFPRPCNGSLENVIVLNRRQDVRPEGSAQEENGRVEPHVPSTRVLVSGQSESVNSLRFVKLLESKTGVDKTGRFVLIQVRLSVLDYATAVDETKPSAISLLLNVQFDRCMSAIWEIEQKSKLRAGDTTWLRACAPMSAIVANSVTSMENLRMIVRVDCDDGRSQHVGTFSLSGVLSSIARSNFDSRKGTDDGLLTFERSIHAIAEGPSAHHLDSLLQKGAACDELQVTTREKLACISFKVSSNIELAVAIAKLRSYVDDRVSLRSSVELSKKSLRNVDFCLRILEEEMQTVRNVATRRGSIGYDVSQIQELLKLQVMVDESFACIEEQFVGT